MLDIIRITENTYIWLFGHFFKGMNINVWIHLDIIH